MNSLIANRFKLLICSAAVRKRGDVYRRMRYG